MLRRTLSRLATASCLAAAAFIAPASAATDETVIGPVLVKEANSKALCESVPHRIFVSHFAGTECVAFHVSPGTPTVDTTVVYFNGDIPAEYFAKPKIQDDIVKDITTSARFIAEKTGVRIIFVARPGTLGSSGDHSLRGEHREMLIMNAAVDAIKARLGLKQIVVAGQSRGSQVAAVLLSMGRTDISCAVLGSGSLFTVENERRYLISKGERVTESRLNSLRLKYYDPSDYVSGLPKDAARRIFILGDRADTITPWDQQEAYGQRLRQHGHHAAIIEIKARGREMHGATHMVLPAAVMCAKGSTDQQIEWIVAAPGKSQPTARTVGM